MKIRTLVCAIIVSATLLISPAATAQQQTEPATSVTQHALWDENTVPDDVRSAVQQVPPDKVREVERARSPRGQANKPLRPTLGKSRRSPRPGSGLSPWLFICGGQFRMDSGCGSRQMRQVLLVR